VIFGQVLKSLKVASFLTFTSIARGNIWVIFLTILILVLVSLNLLFVPSLLKGLGKSADSVFITNYSGNIVIESTEDNYLITRVKQLIPEIDAITGVQASTPRGYIPAKISHDNNQINLNIYGIDPVMDQTVFDNSKYLIEGSYLAPGDHDQLLMGIEVAGAGKTEISLYERSLKTVHAGDKVTVEYNNGLSKTYTVKGIISTEFYQTDLQVFITKSELENISPKFQNAANTIHVKTADGSDSVGIIRSISALRDNIKIYSWETYAGGIISSMTQSFDLINVILRLVNGLVAGFTIYIITFIDVANKRKQIGIQRAIGITPGSISIAYVLRALIYSLLAISISSVVFYFYGQLPPAARLSFHFPFGVAYLMTDMSDVISTTYLLIGVSVLAALVPVLVVLRSKLIDAIWG
jgi:putative ABC transport system permease protein